MTIRNNMMTLCKNIYNKKNTYLTICPQIAADENLSLEAKTTWFYAFELKNDYRFSEKDLSEKTKENMTALSEKLKELENAGYLHSLQKGNDNSHKEIEWYLLERPKTKEEFKKMFLNEGGIDE